MDNDATGDAPEKHWVKHAFIIANIAGVVILAIAMWAFGSIQAALTYVAGDRLILDAREKSFGDLGQGDRRNVEFSITNRSTEPAVVLGAKASCTCISAEDLPLTLPAAGRVKLKVVVHANQGPGPIAESIRLFTDRPAQPHILIGVNGRITLNPVTPGSKAE